MDAATRTQKKMRRAIFESACCCRRRIRIQTTTLPATPRLCKNGKIVSFPYLARSFYSGLVLLSMSSDNMLQVKLLSENASMPTKGSPLSAGFDLSSAENVVIKAGERQLVKLDISIACPSGTYARIAPRSGLAVKKGIDVGAGVVDADYRGPVGVVLFNFGKEDFHVKVGDRIAQLILEQISMVEAEEVEELDETVRGTQGFGSTGVSDALENPEKKQRVVSPTPDQKMDTPKVDPPAPKPE